MAGIYIHIPYCKQACIYCNFHFSTQIKNKESLISALLTEIKARKDYLGNESVETIYFGGGTPSLLSGNDLKNIISQINTFHKVIPNAEITLEANPDDLTPEKIAILAACNINRLSIGVQSFVQEELQCLQRAHTAVQAENCIKAAQDEGIENITIDLIYGIPGQSDDIWLQNLEKVKKSGIPHFSAYSLTVEPKTQLDHLIRNKKLANIDDDQTAKNFTMLMDWAAANSFEHYEISNFCHPGRESKHNSSYWLGKKYLGLGPSAHSYNGENRQWNIANNELYIHNLNEGLPYFEKELLDNQQKYNEYLMISLRTKWGCDLDKVMDQFGESVYYRLKNEIKPYIHNGLVNSTENILKLTNAGKLLADSIVSDLFLV